MDIIQELNDELDRENIRIHIYFFVRNGKSSTVVDGLSEIGVNLNLLAKHWSLTLGCSRSVNDNKIKISGDHRKFIKNFLINEELVDKKQIILHGA